jgi:hypothetical protein
MQGVVASDWHAVSAGFRVVLFIPQAFSDPPPVHSTDGPLTDPLPVPVFPY